MAEGEQRNTSFMEQGKAFDIDASNHHDKDDDGRTKRTGTFWTASAHIITAVIGSGVLSLAWCIAQLGWIGGPVMLMGFSLITWYCSSLLADCYRSPDPVHGKRNYSYMSAVKANLGGMKFKFCGLAQYVNLVGVSIGYTITTAISIAAVKRSNCFHQHGHEAECKVSSTMYMVVFAGIQIVLSQIPNFHKLSWLSAVAAVMSFGYSTIGLGLSLAKIAGGTIGRTTLTGVTIGVDVSGGEKVWRVFQALGDIAFAYTFSNVLIEIQDTLKSSPPENKVMKRATFVGVSTTTVFYMLCGVLGYAAFGNDAPGNFLTGFGFYEPFWLVNIANIFIAVHLFGAYQVFCQPFFQFVEGLCQKRWPNNEFLKTEYKVKLPIVGNLPLSPFRLVWRTTYVIITAVVAMILPFFNSILGLIGALAFWPLTVYFPIEMYIKLAKIPQWSCKWIWLQMVSVVCLLVSIAATCGSVQGIIHSISVSGYKPFHV